ncbi:MAG: EFR1 family ferrodoxin [Eubacteriales bacterium]|nr:EFR1 family ferrodoxin [Eubacteriales bacterium]
MNKNNFTVFYFTGTGNSRYIARKIAAVADGELVELKTKFKTNDYSPVTAEENVVFVTPTYCYRIPQIVSEWIKRVSFTGVKRVWFVMDCGSGIGNAAKYNKELCDEKGFEYMGTAKIVMPENYIAMFNAPEKDEAARIIRNADPFIEAAAETIYSGNKLKSPRVFPHDMLISGSVNPLFCKYSVTSKPFKAGKSCIGCGKCASLCPTNSIIIKNGKPLWGDNCTHCMACICHCPTCAIEYGRKSKGKARYHCD